MSAGGAGCWPCGRGQPHFSSSSAHIGELVPGREGGRKPPSNTKIAKLVWPSRPESSRNHTVVKLKVICWRRLEGWGRVGRVGVVALTPKNKFSKTLRWPSNGLVQIEKTWARDGSTDPSLKGMLGRDNDIGAQSQSRTDGHQTARHPADMPQELYLCSCSTPSAQRNACAQIRRRNGLGAVALLLENRWLERRSDLRIGAHDTI